MTNKIFTTSNVHRPQIRFGVDNFCCHRATDVFELGKFPYLDSTDYNMLFKSVQSKLIALKSKQHIRATRGHQASPQEYMPAAAAQACQRQQDQIFEWLKFLHI